MAATIPEVDFHFTRVEKRSHNARGHYADVQYKFASQATRKFRKKGDNKQTKTVGYFKTEEDRDIGIYNIYLFFIHI